MVSKYSGELYYEATSQDKLVFEMLILRDTSLSIRGYEATGCYGCWEFSCQAQRDETQPSVFLSAPFHLMQSGQLSDEEWQLKLTLSGDTEYDGYLEVTGEIFNQTTRGFLEGELELISR
ncbi:hypothetical protein [Aeromonas dhakensis]|uniref:hypothetical protein n=1 Tax=Aeromonas dhakensis TaxID=196024 RepID=UPI0038D036C5